MERIEKTVFLSYRRTNIPWAIAIFQNLTQNGYDVFFDYLGIASGDFERIILGNITARAHFLVLLTPSALERCDDPVDWLRREIETALANQRNIVPLMLEGFDFGTPKIASQLTGKLAALKHYNGLSIPPEYFLEAMEKLRGRYLNVPLASVLHPASPFAQQAAAEQKQAAGVAPAVHEGELTAQQWFERGFAAVDIDEQLRFYSEAIRLKPDFADAFYNRSLARHDKGDIEGALQDYNEATRLKARKVFFSFHCERDLWRVNVVRNSGMVEGVSAVGFYDASLWEETKRKGDAAVKKLIDSGLSGTTVTVVLIGAETANRKYVSYEIEQSIARGNGILGIRISSIKDQDGRTDQAGAVPAALTKTGAPVYTWEYGKLGEWVEKAYKKANPSL